MPGKNEKRSLRKLPSLCNYLITEGQEIKALLFRANAHILRLLAETAGKVRKMIGDLRKDKMMS